MIDHSSTVTYGAWYWSNWGSTYGLRKECDAVWHNENHDPNGRDIVDFYWYSDCSTDPNHGAYAYTLPALPFPPYPPATDYYCKVYKNLHLWTWCNWCCDAWSGFAGHYGEYKDRAAIRDATTNWQTLYKIWTYHHNQWWSTTTKWEPGYYST